jgi:hypothetical protein
MSIHERSTGVDVAIVGGFIAVGLGANALLGAVVDGNYGADKAEDYVEQSGYTDVEHVDTDKFLVGWSDCGKDDIVKYAFEATAPNGVVDSKVIVCKGLFKSATLRQG